MKKEWKLHSVNKVENNGGNISANVGFLVYTIIEMKDVGWDDQSVTAWMKVK